MEVSPYLLWTTPIAAIAIATAYWYFTRHYDYWRAKGIPSEPRIPMLVAIIKAMLTKFDLIEVDKMRYKRYGRIYGLYEGGLRAIYVAEPDMIKDILVKDFDSFRGTRDFGADVVLANMLSSIKADKKWKRIRNVITPAFTTGKLKKLTEIILDAAGSVVKGIAEAEANGKVVDIKKLFVSFTMNSIAGSVLGYKIEGCDDPNNKFIKEGEKLFSPQKSPLFFIFALIPKIASLVMNLNFGGYFKDAALEIITERRKSGKIRNDLLQLMIDVEKDIETEKCNGNIQMTNNQKLTSDNNNKNISSDAANKPLNSIGSDKSLSRDELLAQCVLFLLGGYEGTSSILSIACHLLAVNPECQERLIVDIDDVLTKYEGKLTYDCVNSMKYLDQVIYETLRLYPAATRVERGTTEDYKLPGTDITLPKGTVVFIPVHLIHHDPEFYPNPEVFDPERFTPEAKAHRHPYIYLPFGGGQRMCVARRLALIIMKLCLALIFSQFRLKCCEETKVPLELQPDYGIGILRSKSVFLQAEKREDCLQLDTPKSGEFFAET